MTRVGAMPHRIDLIRRDLTARDGRNNEAPVDLEPLVDIPARIDIHLENEVIENRDRRIETASAVIPGQWNGVELDLDSTAAIVWEGKEYELIGGAIRASDHAGRLDHFEITARRIIG